MAKRGRKKGSDGKVSRALLLKIAADEFAEHGYHKTKISTIVQKAELTQPTFYLYFKSKEVIFQELEDSFRLKLTSLTSNSRLEKGIEEEFLPHRIAEGLSAVLHFFADHQSLGRIGFFVSENASQIKEQMAQQIEKNLLEEAKAGYFHLNVDMNIVANGLVGMIERLIITKLWTGQNTADELTKEIVTALLYGLKNN
ncbi:TetR/AcrR family transcriptional regulator [Domibacillus mangrovi]|uniref:TetR family transcriptional regulator n=1 Tax=Domibacillus mangrovi TaxID=1714354 RepID=A0A1Q5P007_9BACI|nr:TetR/AcrR family transcriptional regulator [Domibacillus mangrovi]OKL35442.1 TetR family transcriptional regulator [Domibacillus mangrovi]